MTYRSIGSHAGKGRRLDSGCVSFSHAVQTIGLSLCQHFLGW
jgi:hypothetical protein